MEVVSALLGLGALLLVAGVVAALYVSRHSALSRRVGSFSCDVRADTPEDLSWTHGIAQYAAGRLVWWRAFSLAPRPARSWSRADLTLLERTRLDQTDQHGQPLLLVHCRHGSETFQMLVSAPACAGLVSWLESGPRPVGRVI